MAIDEQRLRDIREGRRGVALGLYIDIADDEWEEFCLAMPTVMALDEESGNRVLDAIRAALDTGAAHEVADEASNAVSVLLASETKEQILVGRMLENVGGRRTAVLGELTPIS